MTMVPCILVTGSHNQISYRATQSKIGLKILTITFGVRPCFSSLLWKPVFDLFDVVKCLWNDVNIAV